MESTSLLFYGLIFGSIGGGLFIYGRKQRAPIPLFCGIALALIPYFISNTYLLVSIGIALTALPFVIKKS